MGWGGCVWWFIVLPGLGIGFLIAVATGNGRAALSMGAFAALCYFAYILTTWGRQVWAFSERRGIWGKSGFSRLVDLRYPTLVYGRERFSELPSLFTNYFHQDWDLDGNEEAVVRQWIEDSSPEEVGELSKQLDTLLALGLSEEDMERAILGELQCNYDSFRRDGTTVTEWVRSIRERLG
ncbi:MAG: contact-dependent growth inhibition system immunity protein [Thermoleophilia bacterium]|nr:contact-dependent growth inhibition system immunity protein [Thermoleophilia bacterium]MDH5281967.1 contact-dependent growth inhibition system immunity protein [Thermoleophilia bacterium]